MADRLKIIFSAPAVPESGSLVLFCGDDLALPPLIAARFPGLAEALSKSAAADRFIGKPLTALTLLSPAQLSADRVILTGLGSPKEQADTDYVTLGGFVLGRLGGVEAATIWFEGPASWRADAAAAADLALGMRLRAYSFERYKTRKKPDEPETALTATIAVGDPTGARKLAKTTDAIADGVLTARDLVNEPPNILSPEEFAKRAQSLEKLGVEVEILDEKKLEKIGMRALLGVGQGSVRESRVVLMRWNGAKNAKDRPLAFIGKGVVFDTGGISIKPAQGMEDMKGDMAGAAAVVGLMQALAARKAKANVVGAIGLVENMPDGAAQRPGDIVTSLSGQTIEIINTDAEGRLVLADLLWYVKDRFKPEFMIDLATLTGAILVALAQEHAGLFSNDDELSQRLAAAGKATGEAVWRMPMGPAYDKMIDSKFADMKNTGGRHGGSITAAQFLKRFVEDVPWAHLDIAGTAMGSAANEINKGWASGYGVRLLDRLVGDYYES